jgi:catechol 2,3-dioxygenase-like lactoylglutathione lyase family enzyme
MGSRLGYFTVGTNDMPKALAFYGELLGSAGWSAFFETPRGGRIYRNGKDMFGVLRPLDERAATVGNGTMCSFGFDTEKEAVDFHAKALALGATNEGDFADRGNGASFGYFRDLDGNKLCVYFNPLLDE